MEISGHTQFMRQKVMYFELHFEDRCCQKGGVWSMLFCSFL